MTTRRIVPVLAILLGVASTLYAQPCATCQDILLGQSNGSCTDLSSWFDTTQHTRTYKVQTTVICNDNAWRTTVIDTHDNVRLQGATGQCGIWDLNTNPRCPAVWSDGFSYGYGQWTRTVTNRQFILLIPLPPEGVCADNGQIRYDEFLNYEDCQGSYCCSQCQSYCSQVGECNTSTCTCVFSPIIVDLSGQGFQLTDARHGVMFDLGATGRPGLFAWTAPNVDNAFLVLDRNHDEFATIDGRELFGSVTPQPVPVPPQKVNGFAALAVYDANGDGAITDADPVFQDLRLWRDLNHNGRVDPGELMSLADAGITSISLNYRESRHQDQYGNTFRYRSTITYDERHGGGSRTAYDVFLMGDPSR
jgi:hypothetical protein